MSKISIKYNGELRVNLIHNQSETSINTDAPVDNNGLGQSFSPTDLTASSLGACMMTIIGIHNSKNKWGVEDMSAEVEKIMQSNPRKIQCIKVDLTIKLQDKSEVLESKIQKAALICPVALSLSRDVEQQVNFTFI
jgi:uncharacterized OsmC-like protein